MKEIEKELEKKSRKKQEEEAGVLEFLQKMLPLDATTISREAVLRNVPVYALEEGASLDDILGRVDSVRQNKWMDNPLFRYKKEGLEEINVQPEKAINMLYYPEIHGDVPKEQLLKLAVSESTGKAFIPKMYTDRQSRLPLTQSPSTTSPEPKSGDINESGGEKQPEASEKHLTRLDEGVGAAIKQVGLSWDYMLKNVQKMFTRDEEKRKTLDAEIEEISKEYDSIPDMKGMAQVGAIGVNVVGVALPTVIAGALMSPGAAVAVGGGLATVDMATSASQANMEIDSYERTSGKEVSDNERAAYVSATMATDAIMNVLLGSKVLKGLSPKMSDALSAQLKEAILKNPVAQQEFNTMTRQVIKNELHHVPQEMGREALKSGAVGAVSSGAMEAEKSIYTGQSPELESIVTSVLGGFASGMMQGAVNGATTPMRKHQQRMEKDDVYYVSDMNDVEHDKLPISEIEPQSVYKKGASTYVEGVVSPSTGGAPVEGEYKARKVSGGSYKEAHKQGATTDRIDGWEMSGERMKGYEKKWMDATNGRTDEEYYAMRNEVVQGIAADMGVPVTVYRSYQDLPERLKKVENMGENGAVTVDSAGIYVILDHCEGITASNLAAVLHHEAAGHYGLSKLYDSKEAYEADLEKIAGPVYKGKKDYEEQLSLLAELRNKYRTDSDDEAWQRVYDLLRKSENNLRNTTVSELRKLPRKVDLDDLLKDGKPMPTLYEIEQQRKEAAKD